MHLYSGFLQDEIALLPEQLKLTLGAKFEHNEFSGDELQPSGRLAWTPTKRQTVWGAVSRAVRAPARFDVEILTPTVRGNPQFEGEAVLAYELGYRVQPSDNVSLSLALFDNRYTDLRSININTAPPPALIVANGQRGDSRGIELSGNVQATDWWRLRGGYTYLHKHLESTQSTVLPGSDNFEGLDPNSQALIQSMMDLPSRVEFDVIGRSVSALPLSVAPTYRAFDVRLARPFANLECSVTGQNLFHKRHTEFGFLMIPRSVSATITLHR